MSYNFERNSTFELFVCVQLQLHTLKFVADVRSSNVHQRFELFDMIKKTESMYTLEFGLKHTQSSAPYCSHCGARIIDRIRH